MRYQQKIKISSSDIREANATGEEMETPVEFTVRIRKKQKGC